MRARAAVLLLASVLAPSAVPAQVVDVAHVAVAARPVTAIPGFTG